uniref:DNA/RNA-binding protein Alba-like domain-containing protein n=1 Tax=Panagrolaimus sp. JU765 TaxID=591449 RepID=A0AC34RLV7_9BILA
MSSSDPYKNVTKMIIKKNSKVSNIVDYALKKFEDETVTRILFVGEVNVSEKVVTFAEIFKRKMLPKQIYQVNKFIFNDDITKILILLSKESINGHGLQQTSTDENYGSILPNLSKTIPRIPVKRIGIDVDRQETMKKKYFVMDDYADKLLPIEEDLSGPKILKRIMKNEFMKQSRKSGNKFVKDDDEKEEKVDDDDEDYDL